MKYYNLLFFSLLVLLYNICNGQYRLTYVTFSIGGTDTTHTEVLFNGRQYSICNTDPKNGLPIPGTAEHITYVDLDQAAIFAQTVFADTDSYYTESKIPLDYKWEGGLSEKVNGYPCQKYTTVSFSNKIECWVTAYQNLQVSPVTMSAGLPGVLVKFCRNGNYVTQLTSIRKDSKIKQILPNSLGTKMTTQEMRKLTVERLTQEYVIFEDEQICFNPKLEKPRELPYDQTLRFANGTVILKKIHFDRLPSHYRIFAELTEYSNGDAYDRTGSVFILPARKALSMVQALRDSIGILPYFTDKAGERYPGMIADETYDPPVELVRFFTPFGVRKYNEYRKLENQAWAEEVRYKQDISDLGSLLDGDVYIGAFIGNYDAGGHKLSLRLKAYPEEDVWDLSDSAKVLITPLFNTCNIMEMAGQNYGRLFGTDSLTVVFEVPVGARELTLRYISTGHGGWDRGDEFVPKVNTILIDGKPMFTHTPWRSDCGTYRTLNPASGNFWNGMSSSDYSRSGWCPGTATQPVYFNLTGLRPGRHTLTVAIPQGAPEGGSFSSWNVSGALIIGN